MRAVQHLVEPGAQRLDRGARFEDLARQYSEDGSAASGGDLGWAGPGRYVPEFEQALNALQPGQVSQPVVSRFGVHLIQLVEQVTNHISYLSPAWNIFPMHAHSARHGFQSVDDLIAESPAAQHLDARQAELLVGLPEEPQALLDHLLAYTDDQLMALMGLLLALTMPASTGEGGQINHVRTVHSLTDADMTRWWSPTVASYLGSVSKDQIAKVVTEAVGTDSAAPLTNMKKGEAATTAEQLLAGRGWLPELMRKPAQV